MRQEGNHTQEEKQPVTRERDSQTQKRWPTIANSKIRGEECRTICVTNWKLYLWVVTQAVHVITITACSVQCIKSGPIKLWLWSVLEAQLHALSCGQILHSDSTGRKVQEPAYIIQNAMVTPANRVGHHGFSLKEQPLHW